MSVTISKLTRWSIRLAAVSCVVAIAVGQLTTPAPVLRLVEPVRFVSVPGSSGDSGLTMLDVESGSLTPVELAGGDILENASCAPWKEESGQRQVVGRWRMRSGQGAERLTTEFGLGRYTFPKGDCLDQVVTDILPQGPPCWYPGTSAKVLFAAADGGLYRFAFEGVAGPDTTPTGRDLRPHPIVWKIAPPGENERSVRISDPVWPTERNFGGRIIVSLRFQVQDRSGEMDFSAPRPWWLKLDAKGEAIEAAGPLAPDDTTALDADLKVRFPRPIRLADGSLRLASLSRHKRSTEWNLSVANLIMGEDGAPQLVSGTEIVVARRCAHASLANSLKGDWIYYVPLDAQPGWVLRTPTLLKNGSSSVLATE